MITAHHQIFGRKYKQPIPTDFISGYKFNSNLNDEKGLRNLNVHGTFNEYSINRHGEANKAIRFNENLILNHQINLLPVSPVFTISFWYMGLNNGGFFNFFEFGNWDYSYNQGLRMSTGEIGSTGQLSAMIKNTNFHIEKTNNLIDFNYNNWQHFVIQFDRSQPLIDEIKIYRNNVLMSTNVYLPYNTESTGNFNANRISIGGRMVNNSGKLNGYLSDFYIYDRLLAAQERTNLYNE